MNDNLQKLAAAGVTILGLGGAGAIVSTPPEKPQPMVNVTIQCESRPVEALAVPLVVQSEGDTLKIDNTTGW